MARLLNFLKKLRKIISRMVINLTTDEELRERMEEFIEGYYNVRRLHSALGYRSPEDFEKERLRESPRTAVPAMMTFFDG
jgi:putative transposase